ncbi:hypothetical protein B0F90DRAFT_1824013 [Multifurca ochricompacta]|uniref:Uncharacterized protein n=1 Tax=Multifurca ochricompacta TaxID=376703 RepID=A0AAD4LVQ1_9AGAM|nr:hypothetical protein B0F90DRAFT_1824013 [Multifurca ochricompacta]
MASRTQKQDRKKSRSYTSSNVRDISVFNVPQQLGRQKPKQQCHSGSVFVHPGAKAIYAGAASGDGPYECRKCGHAVLTVTVAWCPACLDLFPWLPPTAR